MNLQAIGFMFIVKARTESIGGDWVISNTELMEYLGIGRDKLESVRREAVEAGLISYQCRSENGSKKGVYRIGYKCGEIQHMLANPAPLIYNTLLLSIKTNKRDEGKPSIYPETPHLPKPTIAEEFDSIWPELRINDRSNRHQSLIAFRNCRSKFTAEEIKNAWLGKVASYSAVDWVCGFQVFCKIENIKDWLQKPVAPTTPMSKFDVKNGEWDL